MCDDNEKVKLECKSLEEIFKYELTIPNYQRIYCWTKKNVIELLDDINGLKSEYRLGTIILHKIDENKYNIVDGQQRLTTLSLLLYKLDEKEIKLLNNRYSENKSNDFIRYNYYLIGNYVNNFNNSFDIETIKKKLTFNVLIIDDENLDLAYTFFSNVNSKGYPLSDFDLLKAHHLRFFDSDNEAQTTHICNIWDKMLEEEQVNEKYERSYEKGIGLYIYRLRKWLKREEWDEDEKLRIKNEFEAAPIIDSIPPFGEKFEYNEPIQGGPHFFNYVNIFNKKYKEYIETEAHNIIDEYLSNESHWYIKDAVESFVFGYYLKFGTDYLIEAMSLIVIILSKIRFDNARLYQESVLEYAGNTNIAMVIEQSSSPTFMLAQLKNKTKTISFNEDYQNIRKRYKERLIKLLEIVEGKTEVEEIKSILNNYIKK